MGIKRYYSIADNTITNAFDLSLKNRGTGSNMGASDILEVFSIYGQETTSSTELSRVLIKFPVTGTSNSIEADRTSGDIPASGSVSFYLKLYNARHSEQLPKNCTMNVLAVSQSWQEGYGLDMESYTDKTKDKVEGSNWMNRNSVPLSTWKKIGGDYHTASSNSEVMYTVDFPNGDEDLELDVTQLVEEWILGNASGATEILHNYGFGIFLTSSDEAYYSSSTGVDEAEVLHNTAGQQKSFYTKRFFSRSTEFFFKQPSLEARWDSRTSDDRGSFYASSSLAPADDNNNNLYLYNYIRGTLRDIPGDSQNSETITVSLYLSDANKPLGSALATATASKVSTGIYKAQVAVDTTASFLHDVWSGSVGGVYKTGSIDVKSFNDSSALFANDYNQFTTKITNLKDTYSNRENARFRVFTRPRNYTPSVYTVATTEAQNTVIPSASFEGVRIVDNSVVIEYSTGSADFHTYLSYDKSGSYFDLDMSLLEPGYMYGVKLSFYDSDGWRAQEEIHKFRVEKN